MQANRPRRREYNTSINAFFHALKEAKHEVEWRALEYDEKRLDARYDLVILGLGTISEFSCTYLYEALLATRANNILYLINDWKANGTIKTLVDGDLFRDFVLRNNTGNRLEKKRVLKDERRLEECRNQMFRWKDNLVGPFFGFGDRSIITEGTPFESCYEYDPSSFYLRHWRGRVQVPKRKERQWVYGALSDYSKWHQRLGAEWPILAYNKKTFIPEEQLVKKYAESYGMILPKYKASGSGWWRARYCHAILCQNVIYGDGKELDAVTNRNYLGHPFGASIEEIESMSSKGLKEFSEFQCSTLKAKMPKWDAVVDTVDGIVREVLR